MYSHGKGGGGEEGVQFQILKKKIDQNIVS